MNLRKTTPSPPKKEETKVNNCKTANQGHIRDCKLLPSLTANSQRIKFYFKLKYDYTICFRSQNNFH